MEFIKKGNAAFSYIQFKLDPQETILTEPGAMASMSAGIELRARLNGGIIRAFLLSFLGKESIFINSFTNRDTRPRELVITQRIPGEIVAQRLNGETLYIQPGSYIASTKNIRFRLDYAGIHSFLAGEGLFRLRLKGRGTVWFGAFGAVIEKEINGDYIVDGGHLLSYPPEISLSTKMSGNFYSTVFGGEGIVTKLSGKGKILLQTRSLRGLAGWLNPRFWS